MIARCRVAALLTLLIGITLPRGREPVVPAHAAANPSVWTLPQRTFNPADARHHRDYLHRAAPYYLVEVALSSSDAGDEAYVQLGDNAAITTKWWAIATNSKKIVGAKWSVSRLVLEVPASPARHSSPV